MNYTIEVYDTWGRRIGRFQEAPLLRVERTQPDRPDVIRGTLPAGVTDLGHGYRVRVLVEGNVFLEAYVTRVAPQWSDTRKLILDRFVHFHEVIEFEAVREARDGDTRVSRAFINRPIDEIVRLAINSAPGAIHYLVDHTAYPDGAKREYSKFLSRKTAANELETGGIAQGQWVDSSRIDATNAVAKDGDTISGLVVDGIAWPDVRLMLIDAEETSRNSHAESLHGEVAGWTDARYGASGYKIEADSATAFLQNLIDTKGFDFIELNPHKNAEGEFDDRVDVFGRYLGFVYGGGECFNAAMVETGHATVYLFEDGEFLVPEMALKDYFSYVGANTASIDATAGSLADYDVTSGAFEVLTALAYAADGFVWSIDSDLAVTFRKAERPDRVVFFDRVEHAVTLGSDSAEIVNGVVLKGNPIASTVDKLYVNGASIDEFGLRTRALEYFSISRIDDGDALANGLLHDIAYPTPGGEVTFLYGDADVRVGDLIEVRSGDPRRLDREIAGEWGDRFTGRLLARAASVTHEFRGRIATTTVGLTSPLRSVDNPLSFIVRTQPLATSLFQFRLDDDTVGLDLGYHLD